MQIRALRRKLENSPSSVGSTFKEAEAPPKDISVFLWPAHRIVHLPEGTTAGHVLRTQVGLLRDIRDSQEHQLMCVLACEP